jgi:hypothetical protein
MDGEVNIVDVFASDPSARDDANQDRRKGVVVTCPVPAGGAGNGTPGYRNACRRSGGKSTVMKIDHCVCGIRRVHSDHSARQKGYVIDERAPVAYSPTGLRQCVGEVSRI